MQRAAQVEVAGGRLGGQFDGPAGGCRGVLVAFLAQQRGGQVGRRLGQPGRQLDGPCQGLFRAQGVVAAQPCHPQIAPGDGVVGPSDDGLVERRQGRFMLPQFVEGGAQGGLDGAIAGG